MAPLVPTFVAPVPLSSRSSVSLLSSRSSIRPHRNATLPRFSRCVPRMVASEPVVSSDLSSSKPQLAEIGLVGLAVMGQNLALNIASKGFRIAVYNRSAAKVVDTVARAESEGLQDFLSGYENVEQFVNSLARPRKIVMLVKAGKPVDATIETLKGLLEEGDMIIDGGNEFYTNTERRGEMLKEKGILYMGMGVSGGEEGARYGPSLMPGGPREAWETIRPMMEKVSAQVDDGPCVTYIGPGGSGNYVKMVHNGIEYGDMQLIGEAYDLLRNVAGLTVPEIADVFDKWNGAELQSFLIEITAKILRQKDDVVIDGKYLIDRIRDQTGSKGTGMWTIQEAAMRAVPSPTIAASLEARYISALKEDRKLAASVLKGPAPVAVVDPATQREIVDDIRKALYASKICSYAQGMNLIREAGLEGDWGLNLGAISRIWKGGCIIRAKFLDRIKAAYDRDGALPNLLLDEEFAAELNAAQESWRRIAMRAIENGIAIPSTSGSLAYYDSIRREVLLSAQMVQAQRDFFGSHTYQRLDRDGVYHTRWSSDGVTILQD
eukprot:GFKZ01002564.1.p1 GENE.GFKZ01002564.1~~GFKZ01002564.1.p1  ORF type:complete len:549 (+),score=88.45 GFKZ01002564.1:172-1818(+)